MPRVPVQTWPGLQNAVCWEGKEQEGQGRKGKGQWRGLTAHIWKSIPGTQISLVPWTEGAGWGGTDLHGGAVLAMTGTSLALS